MNLSIVRGKSDKSIALRAKVQVYFSLEESEVDILC